jgi:3-oxoacyl-[acyl-carrier-protein] synthase II
VDRLPTITGIGLVSPLAVGATGTWRALLDGAHIRDHARTPLDRSSPDRIHRLALAAAEEALAEAAWLGRPAHPGRTALVVGTSKGEIESWTTPPPPPPAQTSDNAAAGTSAACGLAATATRIRAAFPSLDGPTLTLSAACASGLHALIRAAMMIRSGAADRVLVVAAEASVHALFLASFGRLGVLPAEGFGCRPFDVHRDGFLMSEAAAAVCLEAAGEDSDAPRPYAAVDRFAMGGDASHLTGGDPDGRTLRHLIKQVLAARPVDLIHAHGTGTVFNDPVELAAFDDLCAAETADQSRAGPLVYSHKGALGHSLGAAGMMSLVLSCLMHRHSIIPPNVQTRMPLPTRRVRINREAIHTPIQRSLAVAAGFGGATAVVSLVSTKADRT